MISEPKRATIYLPSLLMPSIPGNPLDMSGISYFDALQALESGQLPGHEPLKQWEDPTKLNIEVNAYGWSVFATSLISL